jgi:hypothetical protein
VEFRYGHVFVDRQISLAIGYASVRHGGTEVCDEKGEGSFGERRFGSDPIGAFAENYSLLMSDRERNAP